MDWFEVLKNKLIATPITDVNIKKIPKKKERDCCEEAKDKYNKVQRPRLEQLKGEYHYKYTTMADKLDCDEFKAWLKRKPSYRKDGWIKRIVDKWEECENA
jgi:hypothetical protein